MENQSVDTKAPRISPQPRNIYKIKSTRSRENVKIAHVYVTDREYKKKEKGAPISRRGPTGVKIISSSQRGSNKISHRWLTCEEGEMAGNLQ